jgi:SAM-dependent MidA family methyltransferase
MELEQRREAVPAPPAEDPGEPRLLELLRAEIEQQGPLTFARFMQRALYEPELGYYATSVARPTRAGDFLTAPELHPVFGHALARQLHEMWKRLGEPAEFTLREYGAGGGALAVSLLDGLRQLGSPLLEHLAYQPVDLPGQLAMLSQRLRETGHAGVLKPPEEGGMVGCVLANEYLDALPVHRVIQRGGQLREIYVGWRDGALVEEIGALSDGALAGWFKEAGIALGEGQRAEVNLAMLGWLDEVARHLERGYALVIDYGAEPAELYGPRRFEGTLRAFRRQHVSSDVLRGAGRQDLTAHIDLAALARGARRSGLKVLGRTTQAEFLLGCGLEEALAQQKERLAESWEGQLALRSAVARLLDPRALGGYAVVVLGSQVAEGPRLRGLGYRLPPRS